MTAITLATEATTVDIQKVDDDGNVLSTVTRFSDPIEVHALIHFFQSVGALRGDRVGQRTGVVTFTLDNVRGVFWR